MAGFGQGDYEERVTHLIAPTIAQLAKAISEKHWKPLQYQVRQGLRPFSASDGIVCARLALVLPCKILHTLAQPTVTATGATRLLQWVAQRGSCKPKMR
jgi:hypothetical protein